jgi:putative ABC transport system permease protein
MSAFRLAWRYLCARLTLNVLTGLTVAFGVTLVIAASAVSRSTKSSVMQSAGGYQLLVAAKGSPVQAVMSSLFFVDAPTGNVPIDVYRQLKADRGVARLVPINMGDSYQGFYIVGTTADYFALVADMIGRPVRTRPPNRVFEKPFESVVGASVARDLGLEVGDRLVGVHGFIDLPKDLADAHETSPYTVVAVLEKTNTPADKAIFTTVETVWAIHHQDLPDGWETPAAGGAERHDSEKGERKKASEITALLVQGQSYPDLMRLAATVARSPFAQAIFPARIVTRLLEYLRIGEGILLGISWLTTVVAFFAIMISMLAATIDRRRQVATLRALGAGRWVIAKVMLLEAGLVATFGAIAGIAAGRGAAYLLGSIVQRMSGLRLELRPVAPEDLLMVLVAAALGILAGAVPAYSAYRQDIARNLAPSA